MIVQNAGQGNIAANGGQQVNVHRNKQGKRRAAKEACIKTKGKRASKVKPKQLASSSAEENISMKPVVEAVPAVADKH